MKSETSLNGIEMDNICESLMLDEFEMVVNTITNEVAFFCEELAEPQYDKNNRCIDAIFMDFNAYRDKKEKIYFYDDSEDYIPYYIQTKH